MRRNKILTVNSTLGKSGRKSQKVKRQSTDIHSAHKETASLKTAMIVLPLLIIGFAVAVLMIGINQYHSMFAESDETVSKNESAVPSAADESKLLLVISPDSPLPSDYKTDLVSYDGADVDRIILNDLKNMMNAAVKDNIALKITGGYVSAEMQHELYMDEVRRLMAQEGYGEARAMEEAEKTVPMENHSELQSGLAVTFSSMLTADFSQSEEYRWLCKNSIKYGFILRYPEGKERNTGFEFTPSQFRYVGIQNAEKIRTFNMCLDEYVYYLESRE